MAYCHLPQSFSTAPADTARSNTLHVHMGHAISILSNLLQKYCIIELEISPYTLSRAWNFKTTHKNKIQNVSQLSCWFPFPQPQIWFMEVCGQAVRLCKRSRVRICPQPFCPPLSWHPREGQAPASKECPCCLRAWRVWGLYFTGLKALWKSTLRGAAVRGKKKCHGQNFCLQTWKQSNEKHCRRIHW